MMKGIRHQHPAMIVAIGGLLFGLLVVLCHRLLQDDSIYVLVGEKVQTYQRVNNPDGSWFACKVSRPFTAPTSSNLLSWDASHYNEIRQYLYSPDKMWVGNFAFFPLFPVVWRLSQMGPMGISVFNYLLYVIGLAIVALIFGRDIPYWKCLLMLCAPMAVIYMIPYSEALFFITIALGMIGMIRHRYWLFFVGFFLACTTRAAGNILGVAFVIADVLMGLRNKDSVSTTFLNILSHLAPIVSAVLLVVLFQHLRGAEHWFEYVLAQQYWGKELSWPTWPFSDWSQEGASVSQPLIYILTLPALLWLVLQLWKSIKKQTSEPVDDRYQLRLLSVLFFVGNVLLALFTQHGCLFSQARLLSCTPFFAFLLVDMSSENKSSCWKIVMLSIFLLTTILLHLVHLLDLPILSMEGSWIVLSLVVLVFFGDCFPEWLRYPFLGAIVVVNVVWTAYLFNCFLTNGYIFT